jgi:hypothetical protein
MVCPQVVFSVIKTGDINCVYFINLLSFYNLNIGQKTKGSHYNSEEKPESQHKKHDSQGWLICRPPHFLPGQWQKTAEMAEMAEMAEKR